MLGIKVAWQTQFLKWKTEKKKKTLWTIVDLLQAELTGHVRAA